MFYSYQPPPPPPQRQGGQPGHSGQEPQYFGGGMRGQQQSIAATGGQQQQRLGGGGGSKPMKCMACDVWCGTNDLWMGHLTSEAHQMVVASRPQEFGHDSWREASLRLKCLVVSGVRGLGIAPVITYLYKWGTVLDFIRHQDRRFSSSGPESYFVLYESEESVQKIMQAQTRAPHSIMGQQIFFRKKYEPPRSTFVEPDMPAGMISRDPKRLQNLYQTHPMPPRPPRPPAKSALSLVSTSYSETAQGSGLGFLQSTYDEEEEEELDSSNNVEEIAREDHDLFSVKMTEHLAKTLGKLTLEDQMEGFSNHILLSAPFLAARFKMIQDLQLLLQKQYPKCTIYACGPDYIGIGCSDDPVVVFVDLFDKYGAETADSKSNPWERSKTQLIPEVFKMLKNEQDNSRFCSNLIKKQSDSCDDDVQVLTFTHLQSQVKCCIRTEGFHIVQESMLIKFLCTLDPRVRPLLILVRYWCSFHKILNGQEEIRNKLIVLLMLFHLANKNVIPTVSFLQSLDHKKVVINNYDASFSSDTSKIPQDEMKKYMNDKSIFVLSVLSVLKEFFERFALASYKEFCVCLWPAKFIMRKHLEDGQEDHLSDDFALKLRFGCNGEVLQNCINKSTPMCVQDFFDMSRNVAKGVVTEDLKQFQIKCWESCEKLEKILNSSKQHLLDLFVNTEDLLNQMVEEEEDEVSIQEIVPSRWEEEEKMPVRKPPRDDLMSLEWEDFSKSLEADYHAGSRKTSTPRGKPVAPVAPSQKIDESFNSWYETETEKRRKRANTSSSFNYSATSSAHLARPPLRYEAQPEPGPSRPPTSAYFNTRTQQNSNDNLRQNSNSSSSDDSSGDSDSEGSEEEEDIQLQPSSITRAAIRMPKINFPKNTKLFFIKAVEDSDFLYGIQGKIQALYLNFMKDFTYKFWEKCLGFHLDLDPPHQDTSVAEYARFNTSSNVTISNRMDTVPLFEESISIAFFCQSRNYMNKLLNSRDCEMMNGKFIRKQVKPMLALMMDTRDPLLKPGFSKLISSNGIRFRCTVSIQLDYEDLNRGFAPHTILSFEDVGSHGGFGWPRLRFFGKLFSRMAPRYVLDCYKKWLSSCVDFDRSLIQKSLARERNEEGRARNLQTQSSGGGGISKKKAMRKEEKKLKRLNKARRRLEQSEMEIARRQQELQLQQGSRGRPAYGGPASSVTSSLSSSRTFQVPPSWNRSTDYDNNVQPQTPYNQNLNYNSRRY